MKILWKGRCSNAFLVISSHLCSYGMIGSPFVEVARAKRGTKCHARQRRVRTHKVTYTSYHFIIFIFIKGYHLCILKGSCAHLGETLLTLSHHFLHGESRFEPRRFGKTSVTSVASAPRHGIFRNLMFRDRASKAICRSWISPSVSPSVSYILSTI